MQKRKRKQKLMIFEDIEHHGVFTIDEHFFLLVLVFYYQD